MARDTTPPNPAENTAQRAKRLQAEAKEAQAEENQITTMASLFENPDGTDNRVYDLDGNVVDDTLTEDQSELFASMAQEIEEVDVVDLGFGSHSNVLGVPEKKVAEQVNRPNRETNKKVVHRAPEDPMKVMVDVQALDDIDASIGYNDGKTYKMERGKVYRINKAAAMWLINQKWVGPPPQLNWVNK